MTAAGDIDRWLEKAYTGSLLPESAIRLICLKTIEVLSLESNVRSVSSPVVIVGDIHGQFHDMLQIFRLSGDIPNFNYIFLGDYVDRGFHSVQVITLLACLKCRFPERITLVRGNHETRTVTRTYGFYAECLKKYGNTNVWNHFTELFDYLVIGVLVDDRLFCVHGGKDDVTWFGIVNRLNIFFYPNHIGLSPSIHTIDQIRIIDRIQEIPFEGPFSDLVWSDPFQPIDSEKTADGESTTTFGCSPRGAGYLFGKDVVDLFLEFNGLDHIIRAHQLCMEGYQVLFNDKLSTVWSAPNYCYRAGNMASVLEISATLERKFNIFGPSPDDDRQRKRNGALFGVKPPALRSVFDEMDDAADTGNIVVGSNSINRSKMNEDRFGQGLLSTDADRFFT